MAIIFPKQHLLRSLLTLFFLILVSCAPWTAVPADRPLIGSLQIEPFHDGARLTLLVTNTAERPVDVSFRTGQTYDFVVRDAGGRVLWRWSDDQVFTQALRRARWDAGATHAFYATWQRDGAVSEPLRATGMLTSDSHPIEQNSTFELP